MKACPFRAEQIQDAAIVCRFCNRDLPTALPPVVAAEKAKTDRFVKRFGPLALLVVIAFVVYAFVNADGDSGHAPTLDISAAKNAFGLEVTNRESIRVRNCAVRLLERGRPDEWTALITSLAPLESKRVDWDAVLERRSATRVPRDSTPICGGRIDYP